MTKETLIQLLKNADISGQLNIDYRSHDNGGWISNAYSDTNYKHSQSIQEILADYVSDLLEGKLSDWKDGAGSTGTIIIDIEKNTVTIKHTKYI